MTGPQDAYDGPLSGSAGLRPQPLGDLERDADFQAVAGQREREQPLGALEAVEDRVAVGVQGPGHAVSIRYGTSWSGQQPGVYHWRNSSVGFGFGWLGLGLLGGAFL